MALTQWNGQLKANDIYTALKNQIISQRVYDITTATPELADMLRVDGTLYGDTKTYTSMDIQGSYDFENDAEAANLLKLNRNKTQFTQAIKMDVFRQCNVTVDRYLTKQAWMDDNAFGDFTGVLLSSLNGTKRIYDNGIINTFVGTQESSADEGVLTVTKHTAGAGESIETVNRLNAQMTAEAFANLSIDLGDNSRSYNELNYTRSVPFEDCLVVYNSKIYNKILKIDLPTIFHDEEIRPRASFKLPGRYFGTVNAAATNGNTAIKTTADGRKVPGKGVNGAVRSLIEQDIGAGANKIHYFPGDAIADGVEAPAGTSYTEDSEKIICKIFPAEAVPFMSSFEVGTTFNNPRSLTETEFLTWGHNTLERIKEHPFITMKYNA